MLRVPPSSAGLAVSLEVGATLASGRAVTALEFSDDNNDGPPIAVPPKRELCRT
jgi:hypothetical protein